MKSRHHPIHLAARAESGNEPATIIYTIRRLRSATALGALGFAFVFALWPSSLEAECPGGWDVSKPWELKQSDGNTVHMELRQGYEVNLIAQTAPPTSISGTASYNDKNGLRVGKVKGTVLGNKFNVQVIYSNGSGHWIGTILPSGIIQGSCSDDSVRAYKATFVSDRAMRCVPPPPPTPEPPPSQPPTDNIKPGSFVILQWLPRVVPRRPYAYDGLVIGQKYEVIGDLFGLLTIRQPGGKAFRVPQRWVTLAQ